MKKQLLLMTFFAMLGITASAANDDAKRQQVELAAEMGVPLSSAPRARGKDKSLVEARKAAEVARAREAREARDAAEAARVAAEEAAAFALEREARAKEKRKRSQIAANVDAYKAKEAKKEAKEAREEAERYERSFTTVSHRRKRDEMSSSGASVSDADSDGSSASSGKGWAASEEDTPAFDGNQHADDRDVVEGKRARDARHAAHVSFAPAEFAMSKADRELEAEEAVRRDAYAADRGQSQADARRQFAIMNKGALGAGVVSAKSAKKGVAGSSLYDDEDDSKGRKLYRIPRMSISQEELNTVHRLPTEGTGSVFSSEAQSQQLSQSSPAREGVEALAGLGITFELPRSSAEESTDDEEWVHADAEVDPREKEAERAERQTFGAQTAKGKRKAKGAGEYAQLRGERRAGDTDPEQFAERELKQAQDAKAKELNQIKREESRAMRAALHAGRRGRQAHETHVSSVNKLVGFTPAAAAVLEGQERDRAQNAVLASSKVREEHGEQAPAFHKLARSAFNNVPGYTPGATEMPWIGDAPEEAPSVVDGRLSIQPEPVISIGRPLAPAPQPAIQPDPSIVVSVSQPAINNGEEPVDPAVKSKQTPVAGKPWLTPGKAAAAAGVFELAAAALIVPKLLSAERREQCGAALRSLFSPRQRALMTPEQRKNAWELILGAAAAVVGLGFGVKAGYDVYKNRTE